MLISRAQRAVLADFGISRIAMTSIGTTTVREAGVGTKSWMAPELILAEEPQPATRESDMWAFACVCYEVSSLPLFYSRYPVHILIMA